MLGKVSRVIDADMTQSGVHSVNPWTYVDAALYKTKALGKGIGKLDAYYFYMRSKEYPEVSAMFNVYLAEEHKASSSEDMSNRRGDEATG